MSFCLDANVFIEAHRKRYPMDVAPGFWDALWAAARVGDVFSIDEVFGELKRGGDELSTWAERHRADLFRDNSEPSIQIALAEVARAVDDRRPSYTSAAKSDFFDGADSWLIAYCLVHGHTLVTEETGDPRQITKVRIPDIAAALQVPTIPMLTMIRYLKIQLVLG